MIRIILLSFLSIFFVNSLSFAAAPTTIDDFFMPGSQPNESGNFESPDKCDNCHGGYDESVEPAFLWRGSMMSQSMRDPLFLANLAIANQDAPQSGDLCLRCHSPQGWLEGRSEPTDGSALTTSDREGIHCDFCHKLVKPTELGVNPFPDDTAYTSGTYDEDQAYLSSVTAIPPMSSDGMYIADDNVAKRGPFTDAVARHQKFYSPFHSTSEFCGTCHDVSNPVFDRDQGDNYAPNTFGAPAEDFNTYALYPVERTYSEWKFSAFNSDTGIYAPQFGGNKDRVSSCQDCHLKDVTGRGANKNDVPLRDNLPWHDMTGGNTFVPMLIESVFPGETDQAAIAAGIQRARGMLQKAASMNLSATTEGEHHQVEVTITNETGHKLPSGYPEGRRIWLNVKAYDTTGTQIFESAAYDSSTGVLTHDEQAKIYEIKPGLSPDLASALGLSAGPSFHFAVNDTIYLDNRIPPRGFTNADYDMIQSPPVGYSYNDGQYWDVTDYAIPGAASRIVASLYYQTTSKEFIDFLQSENQTDVWGDTIYTLWANNGKSTPVLMNVDTIDVTPIQSSNLPPVVSDIPDQTVDEGSSFAAIVLDDFVTDPDNTDDQLVWTYSGNIDLLVDITDRVATIVVPDSEWNGGESITFRATDPEGLFDEDGALFTVTPVNDPPIVSDIPDQTVDEGSSFATIVLDDFVSDPDNTDDQLVWTYSGNIDLLVDITDRVATVIVADSEWNGGESITFRATDPGGLFDENAALFTVTPVNDPPIVSDIPDQYVGPGETFAPINLDEYASDVDNDLSELVWTYSGNDALTVGIADHIANVSVPDDQWSGSETIIFRATDPGDGFGEDAATFTRATQGNCCLEHGIPGDANADNSVNLLDILRLIDVIYTEPTGEPHNEIGCDALYDANGSGTSVDSPEINLLDILYLINAIYNDPTGVQAPCCPPGCQSP